MPEFCCGEFGGQASCVGCPADHLERTTIDVTFLTPDPARLEALGIPPADEQGFVRLRGCTHKPRRAKRPMQFYVRSIDGVDYRIGRWVDGRWIPGTREDAIRELRLLDEPWAQRPLRAPYVWGKTLSQDHTVAVT